MRLYLLLGCPFAHRAVMVLREKTLPFDLVFFERGKRPPELEALGSRAKSPTLFDGEAQIYDSAVVLEYLEDRYPDPPLLPAEPVLRAQVRLFQARVTEELMPKHVNLLTEVFFKAERDSAKVSEARSAYERALEPWNRHFEQRRFAVGDALTLADITLYTVFPATARFTHVEIPSEYDHLRAWRDRIAQRTAAAVPEPTPERRDVLGV